jgi:hypothetical protein
MEFAISPFVDNVMSKAAALFSGGFLYKGPEGR